MSRRPAIELRLLRFADGPHPGMGGPINIFEFPGDEGSVAYVETDFALQEVNKANEVEAYTQVFNQARAAALESPATTAHLKQLAESLE